MSEAEEKEGESEGERRRRRRGRRGGRARPRREEAAEAAPLPSVSAETIELVAAEAADEVEREEAIAELTSWPAEAGVETASLAPLAGEPAEPMAEPAEAAAPAPTMVEPAPTGESEEGIPFTSEVERVFEAAAAPQVADAAASRADETVPEAEDVVSPPAPARPGEEVLTVMEKPSNPRRGWWQRLMQKLRCEQFQSSR